MRTLSSGNSKKKKKMHTLSVIERYTVNEVVIGHYWSAAQCERRIQACGRERVRESDRKLLKIRFSSNNDISVAESRIAKERKAFCRRKFTLFGDFIWI